MTAEVPRLRPKRHDTITKTLQLALDMPLGLKPSTRHDLAEALDRYQPLEERWGYVMLNGAQLRIILKLIRGGPNPLLTLAVWQAAYSHVLWVKDGVCEIMAGRARLAEDAMTTPNEVSRGMNRLTDMGALLRLRPGRYAINPHVGWNGPLAQREAAAEGAPRLRLVEQPAE